MELSVFEQTALKAESLATKNFTFYKLKLVLFALLGYVVIFSVLSLALGSIFGFGYLAVYHTSWILLLAKKKVIFLLIPAVWILIKACWVKIEAPEGFELKRKQYPELFAEIDLIRKKLRTPKIHKVILTPEMNASISQTPRLGIFGWQKNTLILGMELLLILSPEQSRSVLAHELGHLSGNHSRFNGWIYRIRVTWYKIMETFDRQNSWGGAILAKFFDYYAPRFAAYSFVLARKNEYEADQIASELTSSSITGQALINSYVTAPYVENNYWQEYFKLADDNPEPVHPPWSGLRNYLNESFTSQEVLSESLQKELEIKTQLDNTHPALSDRLSAIAFKPVVPGEVKKNAAQVLLGDNYLEIVQEMDDDWLSNQQENWKSRYDYVQESKESIKKYKARPRETLSEEEFWTLCCLNQEFSTEDKGIALFKEYQAKYPESSKAAYVIGSNLFEKENEACLAQFEIAVKDNSLIVNSCRMAYHFLQSQDNSEQAEHWKNMAEKQLELEQEANQEREFLSPQDKLVVSNVDEQLKNKVIEKLMDNPSIKSAWLAEKEVKYYKETPMLAIAVKPKGMFFSDETAMEKVHTEMDIDASYIIVPYIGDYKTLAKNIKKVGVKLF